MDNYQCYFDRFLWERQESDKEIIWNRLSENIGEGVMYHFCQNTQAWYFHPDSTTKPTKLTFAPCIEVEYRSKAIAASEVKG